MTSWNSSNVNTASKQRRASLSSRDGMALTASTDFTNDMDKNVKEVKRYMKAIAKKTSQFPERCTMKVGVYAIHFITSLGISYLVLCDLSYPSVLAFSFTNELMKEFLSRYDTRKVNEARRPYSFIEFDSLIHKIRQRYNRPQTLTTRVDLSDLSRELKARPPHLVSVSEIEPPPLPNGLHRGALNNVSVGPPRKLQPVPFYGKISIVLTSLFALLNLYRMVIALGASSIEEYDGPSPTHGFLFLLEGILQIIQVVILVRSTTKIRKLEAGVILIIFVATDVLLWDVREAWFAALHLASATVITLAVFRRRYEAKPPNYNV